MKQLIIPQFIQEATDKQSEMLEATMQRCLFPNNGSVCVCV